MTSISISSPCLSVCLSVVSVVCCQVEVSATGRSLVQRSPIESGVSECDRETPIIRAPWPTGGLLRHEKKKKLIKNEWHYLEINKKRKFI